MKWFNRIRMLTIFFIATGLALAGCAGAPVDKTLQTEELLARAGFQLKMADTAAKLARINRLPQKQVVRGMIRGRELYIWADAAGCQCYYAGTRQNYEQLLEIKREKKAEYFTDLYEAQDNDPLWGGNPADWEDALLGP